MPINFFFKAPGCNLDSFEKKYIKKKVFYIFEKLTATNHCSFQFKRLLLVVKPTTFINFHGHNVYGEYYL